MSIPLNDSAQSRDIDMKSTSSVTPTSQLHLLQTVINGPLGPFLLKSDSDEAIEKLAESFQRYEAKEVKSEELYSVTILTRSNRADEIIASCPTTIPNEDKSSVKLIDVKNVEHLWRSPGLLMEFDFNDNRSRATIYTGVACPTGANSRELTLKSEKGSFDWNLLSDYLVGLYAYSRGAMIIHAGYVVTPSGPVAIAGESGAGKTTTTLSCLREGMAIGGDDILFLTFDKQGEIMATPLLTTPRFVGNAPKSLTELEAGLGLLSSDEKTTSDSVLTETGTAPLRSALLTGLVALVKPSARPATHIAKRLDGIEAFREVMALIVDPTSVLRREEHLDRASKIVDQIPVYRVTASTDIASLPSFITSITRQREA